MKEAIELTGVPRDEKPSATDFRVLTELPPLIDSPYPRIAIGDLIDVARLFDPTLGEDEILPFQMEMFRIQQDYSPPGSTFMAILSSDLIKPLGELALKESQRTDRRVAVVHLDKYIAPEQRILPFYRLNVSRGQNDTVVSRPGTELSPEQQIENLRITLVKNGSEEILLVDDVLAYAKTLVPIIKMLQDNLPGVRIRAAVALASTGGEWSGIEKVKEQTGVEVEAQTIVKVSPKTKYSSGMSAPTSRDMTLFGGSLDSSGEIPLSYPHLYPFAIPRPSFFNIDSRLQASNEVLVLNEHLSAFLEARTGRSLTIKDLLDNGFGVPVTKIDVLSDDFVAPSPDKPLADYLRRMRDLLNTNSGRIEVSATRITNKETFEANIAEIAESYRRAFEGPPWFEKLSPEEALNRIKQHVDKTGFDCLLTEAEGRIAGGLWYDTPTLEQLEQERGPGLVDFVQELYSQNGIGDIVWEREVMVHPDFQGQKIATTLRHNFLQRLARQFPKGVIMLTRMRDDNLGIVKIAQNLGYQRTGIKLPSSQNPLAHHEYWYKIIPATK